MQKEPCFFTFTVCPFCIKINKSQILTLGDKKMRISWIKTSNDNNSFKVFENLGFDVYRLNEPDETDTKIEELINNDCKTIILSNEIAAFSEDIITKYKNNDDVSIIIASSKNNEKD